jgi:hypothetical protein
VELRKSKYKKFANSLSTTSFGKAFSDYDKCYEVLGAMVKFRCNKGCKNGGPPPFCRIRKCCQQKKIEGCWECNIFEECEKLDFLKAVYEDGHVKNLKIIKKKGIPEFLKNKRYW